MFNQEAGPHSTLIPTLLSVNFFICYHSELHFVSHHHHWLEACVPMHDVLWCIMWVVDSWLLLSCGRLLRSVQIMAVTHLKMIHFFGFSSVHTSCIAWWVSGGQLFLTHANVYERVPPNSALRNRIVHTAQFDDNIVEPPSARTGVNHSNLLARNDLWST